MRGLRDGAKKGRMPGPSRVPTRRTRLLLRAWVPALSIARTEVPRSLNPGVRNESARRRNNGHRRAGAADNSGSVGFDHYWRNCDHSLHLAQGAQQVIEILAVASLNPTGGSKSTAAFVGFAIFAAVVLLVMFLRNRDKK